MNQCVSGTLRNNKGREHLMMDTELIFAIIRPVHIREEPAEEIRLLSEYQRQQQKYLLEDLQAEQLEQK